MLVVRSIISRDARKSRVVPPNLYTSLGPKAVGVPTNNHGGQSSGPCQYCGGLDNARGEVPTALLVRVLCLLYLGVEGKRKRHMVFSMIPGPYWRRRRRFATSIFIPEEIKLFEPLIFLSLYTISPQKTSWGVLLLHILEMVKRQILMKVQSRIWTFFQTSYEACDISNPVITVERWTVDLRMEF